MEGPEGVKVDGVGCRGCGRDDGWMEWGVEGAEGWMEWERKR